MWREIISVSGGRWYSHILYTTCQLKKKNASGSSYVMPWNVGICWRGITFIGALAAVSTMGYCSVEVWVFGWF